MLPARQRKAIYNNATTNPDPDDQDHAGSLRAHIRHIVENLTWNDTYFDDAPNNNDDDDNNNRIIAVFDLDHDFLKRSGHIKKQTASFTTMATSNAAFFCLNLLFFQSNFFGLVCPFLVIFSILMGRQVKHTWDRLGRTHMALTQTGVRMDVAAAAVSIAPTTAATSTDDAAVPILNSSSRNGGGHSSSASSTVIIPYALVQNVFVSRTSRHGVDVNSYQLRIETFQRDLNLFPVPKAHQMKELILALKAYPRNAPFVLEGSPSGRSKNTTIV